jgi:hypothetical protein
MNKKYIPRIGNFYGMAVHPVKLGKTWIEGELWCTEYGQFSRRGLVRHSTTGELIKVRCDIPDTYFSMPATSRNQHGYVTSNDNKEFEFRPHTDQIQSPKDFRKQYKKDCK